MKAERSKAVQTRSPPSAKPTATALLPATEVYCYDPERAANRRVLAYTSSEFSQLSKQKQRRVIRNRETAQASKAKKRARLQELQELEAKLQEQGEELQAQLVQLQQELQSTEAKTTVMLQGCRCTACQQLQQRLETASTKLASTVLQAVPDAAEALAVAAGSPKRKEACS